MYICVCIYIYIIAGRGSAAGDQALSDGENSIFCRVACGMITATRRGGSQQV